MEAAQEAGQGYTQALGSVLGGALGAASHLAEAADAVIPDGLIGQLTGVADMLTMAGAQMPELAQDLAEAVTTPLEAVAETAASFDPAVSMPIEMITEAFDA
jgi:hypothetical protein